MAMNDSEKARIAGRKEAVKAGAAKGLSGKESRKRYYVRTRVAELEKAGKPVSAEKRKQLREKFNSGNISRKGFAAPKKKTGGSGSSGSSSGSSGSSSGSSGSSSGSSGSTIITQSGGRSARDNMKGASGYKAGSTKASSKQFGPQLSNVSKVAKKKNSGGVVGNLKGAAGKVGRGAKGAKNFLDNELLGKDDSRRVADYIRKGDLGKAGKSLGAAALEIGSLTGLPQVGKGLFKKFAGKSAGKKALQTSMKGGFTNYAAKNSGKKVVESVGQASAGALKRGVVKEAPKVVKPFGGSSGLPQGISYGRAAGVKSVPRTVLLGKPSTSLTAKNIVKPVSRLKGKGLKPLEAAKSGPRVVKKTRSSVKTTNFSNRGKPKTSTTRVRSAPKPVGNTVNVKRFSSAAEKKKYQATTKNRK